MKKHLLILLLAALQRAEPDDGDRFRHASDA
jgi:hypothetical protein